MCSSDLPKKEVITEQKEEVKVESKKDEVKKEEHVKSESKVELTSMTVTELKDLAKTKGLTGYSTLKKAELIKKIENEG